MFSWKIMIQDKDLPKVMWALDGLIIQSEPPIPVRGAEVVKTTNGALKAKAAYSPAEGTFRGQFKSKVESFAPQTELNMTTFKQMLAEAGGAPVSAYKACAELVAAGVLKRQ